MRFGENIFYNVVIYLAKWTTLEEKSTAGDEKCTKTDINKRFKKHELVFVWNEFFVKST